MKKLDDYLQKVGTQLMTQVIDSYDDDYHTHSFYEIFYIVTGSIEHETADKRKTLNTGDMYFLRPNDGHIFYRDSFNTSQHRDILISESLFKRACDFLDPTFFNLIEQSKTAFSIKLSPQELSSFENELQNFSEQQERLPSVDLSATENVIAVKLLYSLLSRLNYYNKKNYPQWITDLITLLNNKNSFVKPLSELLEEVNYNRSYISRRFTQIVGVSPIEYFLNAKIAYAVKLLRFTQMPITEIAIASGFNTITYFNRIFKKMFGVSPSTYRQNIQPAIIKSETDKTKSPPPPPSKISH